jgi:hypothetical protein
VAQAARTGHLIHFPLPGSVVEQQKTLSALVAELASFGPVETIESPAEGYGECHLLVKTSAPESDVKGVLSFLLDPEVIRVEAWPLPMAEEDNDFGLFAVPAASASTETEGKPVVEEAYGFFDDEEVTQLILRQEAAEPYGFFHELPPLPDEPPAGLASLPRRRRASTPHLLQTTEPMVSLFPCPRWLSSRRRLRSRSGCRPPSLCSQPLAVRHQPVNRPPASLPRGRTMVRFG